MNLRITTLFFLIFPVIFATAQYTDELNSNRPGASQGAFSVGKKVLQFESGFSLGKEEHRLLQTETSAFSFDYSIRYGVWKEELEVSLMGEYQSNSITHNQNSAISYKNKLSNFRSNTLGAKYLIYDPYRKMELEGPNVYSWKANFKFQWRDLIPAISIYAGANFDTADNPFTPDPVESTPENEGSISPKFVLSTQNNWIGGFVFVTNIIVDRITTDTPEYSYILTLTHTPTDWFSIFVENQGIKSDFYADQLLRGGVAVLVNQNFHVDGSLLLNFKDTPSRLYGRVGVSYRFDMHDTDEYIEEKGKAGRKNNKEKKKRNKKSKRKDGFEDDGGDGGL